MKIGNQMNKNKDEKFTKQEADLLYTVVDTWVKNQKDSIKAVEKIKMIVFKISLNIEQDNGNSKDGIK